MRDDQVVGGAVQPVEPPTVGAQRGLGTTGRPQDDEQRHGQRDGPGHPQVRRSEQYPDDGAGGQAAEPAEQDRQQDALAVGVRRVCTGDPQDPDHEELVDQPDGCQSGQQDDDGRGVGDRLPGAAADDEDPRYRGDALRDCQRAADHAVPSDQGGEADTGSDDDDRVDAGRADQQRREQRLDEREPADRLVPDVADLEGLGKRDHPGEDGEVHRTEPVTTGDQAARVASVAAATPTPTTYASIRGTVAGGRGRGRGRVADHDNAMGTPHSRFTVEIGRWGRPPDGPRRVTVRDQEGLLRELTLLAGVDAAAVQAARRTQVDEQRQRDPGIEQLHRPARRRWGVRNVLHITCIGPLKRRGQSRTDQWPHGERVGSAPRRTLVLVSHRVQQTLSIVLPAYNEEANIETAVRRASEVGRAAVRRPRDDRRRRRVARRTAETVRALQAGDPRIVLISTPRTWGTARRSRAGSTLRRWTWCSSPTRTTSSTSTRSRTSCS